MARLQSYRERSRRSTSRSQYTGSFDVEILLVAFIASDPEAALEIRRRRVDICPAKGDFMFVEKIISKMKPIVFA